MNFFQPRIESFFKSQELLTKTVTRWFKSGQITGLNLTNKNKSDDLIADAKAILTSVGYPVDICVHFSVKYNWPKCGRTKEAKLLAGKTLMEQWGEFYDEAGAVGVKRVLVVSGPRLRRRSTQLIVEGEACRRSNSESRIGARIGVAWTPCYPDISARKIERQRLSCKLSTGVVDDIWLQFSSDSKLMREELLWLKINMA